MIESRERRETRAALRRVWVTRLLRLLNFDMFQLQFVSISGICDRESNRSNSASARPSRRDD
jgi:hypothetical protein